VPSLCKWDQTIHVWHIAEFDMLHIQARGEDM
jgi:hypothetical protein